MEARQREPPVMQACGAGPPSAQRQWAAHATGRTRTLALGGQQRAGTLRRTDAAPRMRPSQLAPGWPADDKWDLEGTGGRSCLACNKYEAASVEAWAGRCPIPRLRVSRARRQLRLEPEQGLVACQSMEALEPGQLSPLKELRALEIASTKLRGASTFLSRGARACCRIETVGHLIRRPS